MNQIQGNPPAAQGKAGPAGAAKPEGNDAVCFTAGFAGAAFGAGVIHAYLAADRDPPAVAAGSSLGAVNAAALQRVYQELETAKAKQAPPNEEEEKKLEAARWQWFREYVEALSDRPLNVFWDAIPDQSDFFADMVPILDPSAPASLGKEEEEARRRRYLLVRLGQWLAGLPVKVGLAASMVVNFVRLKEKYPITQKLQSIGSLLRAAITVITEVVLYAGRAPQLFPAYRFAGRVDPEKARRLERWLPQKGLVFLAWLNLFNFTVALIFAVVVFGLIIGGTLPEKNEEMLPYLAKWALGILVVCVLLAVSQRIQQWVVRPAVVDVAIAMMLTGIVGLFAGWVAPEAPQDRLFYAEKWGLWLLALGILASSQRVREGVRGLMQRLLRVLVVGFGWLVYLISWINIGSLLGLGYFGYQFVLDFLQGKTSVEHKHLVLGFFALLILPCLLLLPFVVIPGTRKWLIEHGFVQQWKRPLFGWPTYLFVCVHLAGLLGYLTFGAEFIYLSGITGRTVFDWRHATLASTRLLLSPLVVIPVVYLLRECRKRLMRWGKLRRWPEPRWAWISFALLIVAALGGTGVWFHYLLLGFKSYLDVTGLPLHYHLWPQLCVSAWVLFGTWAAIFGVLFLPELGYRVFTHLLDMLGLKRGLIHDYFLRRKLIQLFEPDWKKTLHKRNPAQVTLGDEPVRVLLVAAPLPTLRERGQKLSTWKNQVWAQPGTPLVHALRTALAAPPFFEPTRLKTGEELRWWLKGPMLEEWEKSEQAEKGLDLVDGAVIRQNPLPALFAYLRRDPALAQRMAKANDAEHAAIHVVYRVPLEGRPEPEDAAAAKSEERQTIVDVARLSLRLSSRRDTQLEVAQTNLISSLETLLQAAGAAEGRGKAMSASIFADEIAPEDDLQFKNVLNPTREEILKAAATGCRRTLEALYKDALSANQCSEVECGALLAQVGKPRRRKFLEDFPGLREVCEHCPRLLRRPEEKKKLSTVSVADSLESAKTLVRDMTWLSGERPRIVFVASGGVFRGAFHIGMLAALRDCQIRPDLIVGASVGTLMGGALGAMFTSEKDILGPLVDAFLKVDEQVALTRTLKGAARELGVRGRLIRLSPGAVRRMVQRGSRSDPGFAAAGAPAALIDALSDLFMIPHKNTAEIAAEFVAGHVTKATNVFLQQIKKETLRRMEIEQAVIGTSLLEPLARELLGWTGARLTERQPFKPKKIAFFGTTTNLVTQSPLLLGGNQLRPDAPYDYVEAALASSAFPAVFAPRPESNVFPGSGRTDIFFSDGGMFDNLPFLPAIEILSRGQRGYRQTKGKNLTALEFLAQRNRQPDLLIAGALNALAEEEPGAEGPFETLAAIYQRAGSLANNEKIRSFEYASRRVHDQIERYVNAAPATARTRNVLPLVDGLVDAAVLPVFPASAEHLNGTFAFCASTGLEPWRVRKSIADGCYQTLRVFAEQQSPAAVGLTPESVRGLMGKEGGRRIPKIVQRKDKKSLKPGQCPFFLRSEPGREAEPAPFACPFVELSEKNNPRAAGQPWGEAIRRIHVACRNDAAHQVARP